MDLTSRKDNHIRKLNLEDCTSSEHFLRSPTPVKTLRIDLETELKEQMQSPVLETVSSYNYQRPVKYGNLVLKVNTRQN